MWGPDERAYFEMGRVLREHGLRRGFQLLAERFLRDPAASEYPSCARYGWALASAVIGTRRNALSWASIVLAPLALAWATWPLHHSLPLAGATLALALASPLLWTLGRTALQDAPLAVLVAAAVGFALRAEPVGLAVTLAALLAAKEVSPLNWAGVAVAWFVGGGSTIPLAVSFTAAGTLWAAGLLLALRRQAVPVLRKALSGHGTEYTAQHQQGLPHRLVVDLVLTSPASFCLALASGSPVVAIAGAVVAAHAAAPVRNVRNVLAADLLLRHAAAVAVLAMGTALIQILCLGALVSIGALIAYRLRDIYDPVTAALTGALGMSPNSD